MNPDALDAMLRAEDDHPWYRARLQIVHQWSAEFPERYIGLDIGCGSGAAAQYLHGYRGAQVFGIDVSQVAVDAAISRGVSARVGDACLLDFPDNSLDFVMALDVIEHIQNDSHALTEIVRVLKPSGTCLFTVPAHAFLWSRHDDLNHHFRRYSKIQMSDLVIGAGLKINNLRWWNSTLFLYFLLTRLVQKYRKVSVGDLGEFRLPPRSLTKLLYRILKFEASSNTMGKLIGVSLIVTATK
jgi:SAM-dependent methyltransferase